MQILIVLLLLLISASIITAIFKIKIEQALFILVCLIIIVLLFFGLLGALKIGLYLLYAATACAIFFLIFKFLFSKQARKAFDLTHYLTPGMVIFILSFTLYAIAVRGKVLVSWDEASHWATATHYMWHTDELFKGIQTLGIPVLNYFFVSIAGYRESFLFVGRWAFIWACLALPTANVEWKKSYKVLLYAIAAYFACGTITTDTKLYMDLPLGIAAGTLCAAWALSENQKLGVKVTWLCVGVFAMTQLKDSVGVLFSIFVILFIIIEGPFIKRRTSNYKYSHTLIYVAGPLCLVMLLGYFVQKWTMIKVQLDGFFTEAYKPNIQIISGFLRSNMWYLLLAGLIISLVFAFYCFYRLKKLDKRIWKCFNVFHISLIILTCFILAVCYKLYFVFFSSLDYDHQLIFINTLESFFRKGYWGKTNFQLVVLLGVFTTIVCAVGLKPKYRSKLYLQSVCIGLCVFLYITSLSFAYAFFFPYRDALGLAEFHRYVGSFVVFAGIWLTGYITLSNKSWNEKKYVQLISALLLIVLLSDDAAVPGTVLFEHLRGNQVNYNLTIRPRMKSHADIIVAHTQEMSSIYVIAQNNEREPVYNGQYPTAWMKYEAVPRLFNVQSLWVGTPNGTADNFNVCWSCEQWRTILANNYDYVYIFNCDELFWEKYGELFKPGDCPITKALYRVVRDEDYLLEPVVLH